MEKLGLRRWLGGSSGGTNKDILIALVVNFCLGVAVGYLVWGRGGS